jgi:hypothetical protein
MSRANFLITPSSTSSHHEAFAESVHAQKPPPRNNFYSATEYPLAHVQLKVFVKWIDEAMRRNSYLVCRSASAFQGRMPSRSRGHAGRRTLRGPRFPRCLGFVSSQTDEQNLAGYLKLSLRPMDANCPATATLRRNCRVCETRKFLGRHPCAVTVDSFPSN